MITKFTDFIKEDIWLIQENTLQPVQVFGIKVVRILLLALQGFHKDLCALRASALTLFTLLSIVPVIALLFGIAKGFGFEKNLRERLVEQSPEQSDMMLQLIGFAENLLSNTKGGVVAGIGVVVLFWTVIKVIGNIEESFNHIWRIDHNRIFTRKVTDYLSVMMLAPVMLIASSSITVFVKTKLTWLMQVIHLPEFGTQAVLYGLSFSPYVIMALLFTFMFLFLPNRRIDVRAGFLAGIVTSLLFHWVQWAYLTLQIGASSYNAIYGSFAALPLFLFWLQLCWFVVLLGCEISFYIQNYASYCHNDKFTGISLSLRKIFALKIMHLIVGRFDKGEAALSAQNIASQLHIPLAVVQRILQDLKRSKLIATLSSEGEETRFHPAYDINRISVAAVIIALENSGRNDWPDPDVVDQFSSFKHEWLTSLEQNSSKKLLKEI
jgi:membrane protein